VVVSLERETYAKGEIIIRQGNKGDHFYIIAEGSVNVFVAGSDGKEEKVAILRQGDYFGEKALLHEDVRQASCIADTDVICLSLEREDFINMMGTLDDMISSKSNDNTTLQSIKHVKSGLFSTNVSVTDLEVKNTLGCGAFGRVKLCRHLSTDQYFALKCQAKKAIIDSGLQEHVLNEMRVMKLVSHPYIAQLFSAMQDSSYIYFLLELLQGGELFTHLRNRGKLSEQSARFYAAIVVYAFTSLHAKRIAFRDLKPENLVMDNNGYVKLVDFGLAKQLLQGKTWTLCGTPVREISIKIVKTIST
jgi:serine/threonine protein kinase